MLQTVIVNRVETLLVDQSCQHVEVCREMVLALKCKFHCVRRDQFGVIADMEVKKWRRCLRDHIQPICNAVGIRNNMVE